MEFGSSWILKPSVTKATPPQSQQSQFPSQHILDTEVVPFKGCLTVSTVLSLPITARQSRREGGRDMANPRFMTRWGLASDERVRSPWSIEHRPPGARSIPHYSESFVEERKSSPPTKPWLDGSEDDQRRFHIICAPWEREAWTWDSCCLPWRNGQNEGLHRASGPSDAEFSSDWVSERERHRRNQLPLASSDSEVITSV